MEIYGMWHMSFTGLGGKVTFYRIAMRTRHYNTSYQGRIITLRAYTTGKLPTQEKSYVRHFLPIQRSVHNWPRLTTTCALPVTAYRSQYEPKM